MKKRLYAMVSILLIGIFMFAGCGAKGIDGTWVLTEEYDSNGTKTDSKELKDLGISEKYVIENGKAQYTLLMDSASKPIEFEYIVNDLGDNKYEFNLGGNFPYFNAEVDGNTMTYELGEGDSYSKMVFKRQ